MIQDLDRLLGDSSARGTFFDIGSGMLFLNILYISDQWLSCLGIGNVLAQVAMEARELFDHVAGVEVDDHRFDQSKVWLSQLRSMNILLTVWILLL